MVLIIPESRNSEIFVESKGTHRKIVVLFPMTRTGAESILRWETLIETVNFSEVSNLILIDKTINNVATDYFIGAAERIIPKIIILQRPRSEPIHDSQKFILIQDESWIVQLHDDDKWKGILEIPKNIDSKFVIKTNFISVSNGIESQIVDITSPDCRSIFSLLPARLWNRFTELILQQGGHVAGSIDSSLNLVVNLVATTQLNSNFTYIYDNRHWSNRRSSIKSLAKLTIEDGWKTFPTIQMSLVGRAIDGISSLIFFEEFYAYEDLRTKVNQWIASTKPNILRIISARILYFSLCALRKSLKVFPKGATSLVIKRCDLSINYWGILIRAWKATEAFEYLGVIEDLSQLESSIDLQSRFAFWKKQLLSYLRLPKDF